MKNQYTYLTAKERDKMSFPARVLLERKLLVGEVLDFGCGFGKDVQVLKEKGVNIEGYDNYYFPDFPQKKFDTIICFYVLNVLLPEEQSRVLLEITSLLKPSGKIYFAVRRDLTSSGYRTHKIHRKPTFQCNVILPFHSIFKNEFCEIYEYQPINQYSGKASFDCVFCNVDSSVKLITESATAFAIYDKFPISRGHALIVPKRHCKDYFDLTFKEQSACIFMVNFVKEYLQKNYNPEGFNIGINVLEVAGQTIDHAHIHLIPRYVNDVANPIGGVRNIIPGMGDYLNSI